MVIEIQPSTNKTLLELIQEKGIKIESQCRAGFCNACKCKLKAGVVVHESSALIMSEDDVLPCSAYAATTVQLEIASS